MANPNQSIEGCDPRYVALTKKVTEEQKAKYNGRHITYINSPSCCDCKWSGKKVAIFLFILILIVSIALPIILTL